jgi:hypothetical protein
MRATTLPFLARLVGVLAAAVAAAGMALEGWCALDRAHGGRAELTYEAAAKEVFAHPSAESFARLSRAHATAGNADGAAYAAAVATRLAPNDPALGAEAERTMDAAVRVRVRAYARPASAAAVLVLVGLGFAAARRRREAEALVRTMAGGGGRIRVVPEGSRPAPGNDAMVDGGTKALVLDVEVPAACARRKRCPPVVVYLSNSTANRTIRLSPRSDVASGAVRWRVEGATLATIGASPGRWRVVVRIGPAVLGESSFLVTPSGLRTAA